MTKEMRRPSSVVLRAFVAALSVLVSACWDDIAGEPSSGPPASAWVSIEDHDAKVDTAAAWLDGEAECPGCFASGWQQGQCPQIQCPSAEGMDVRWTNHSTGANGAATHGILPACHCPWPWAYGYCYSACNHVWWATVPLTLGDNDIEVTATVPGFAEGSDSLLIKRAPVAPAWLPALPGPGQVTLAWGAADGATSYNLYWSTTAYVWSSLCTKIANVTSPYTHAGLASGVVHYYYVTAVAGGVESFDSSRLEAIPE